VTTVVARAAGISVEVGSDLDLDLDSELTFSGSLE
jgi:hypothetical protein